MIFYKINYGTSAYYEDDAGDKYYAKNINDAYNFIKDEITNEYSNNKKILNIMLSQLDKFKEQWVLQMNFYNQKDRETELYINIIEECFVYD